MTSQFRMLLVLLWTAVPFLYTQQGTKSVSQIPQGSGIKVDVSLTLVNTTVTDRRGHYVQGLSGENFKLWEDKVEQKIEFFSAEDIPVSFGLILDVSGSMRSFISVTHDAAVTFLKVGNRDNEYFLVEFNERPVIAEEFTTDIRRLENRIISAPATGSTALYDAIAVALDKLRHGNQPRKAILLISDGEDNHSRYSFRDIKEFVREQDVPIYSIGLVPRTQGPSRMFHRSGPEVLQELSTITAGRAFFTDSARDLETLCRRIAEEIQHQYLLGYESTNTVRDGKWRKIQVKLVRPNAGSGTTIRAKAGYYAQTR